MLFIKWRAQLMNGRRVSVRSVASILKLRKCRQITSHHGARAVKLLLKTVKCFVRIATVARAIYRLQPCVASRGRRFSFVVCVAHCRVAYLSVKSRFRRKATNYNTMKVYENTGCCVKYRGVFYLCAPTLKWCTKLVYTLGCCDTLLFIGDLEYVCFGIRQQFIYSV